jgi:alpha-mannosidase
MRKFLLAVSGVAGVLVPAPAYDLSKDHVAYFATDAHLDSQWLYDLSSTMNTFIPNTLRQNFTLFRKYPDYVFNFEGSYRYYLAKKFYPADYDTLKKYIAKGNWAVAGGMVDMSDVNVPSPESVMRQFLYGNGFFMDEFGKKAVAMQVPDNFGFAYSTPTIAAHCGLIGINSSRFALTVPRMSNPIIRWKGVDGSYLIACTKAGDYNTGNRTPWTSIPTADGDKTSASTKGALWATWNYFGTGDRGGSPNETAVASLMARIADNANQTIKVTNAKSDQFYLDLSQAQIDALPEYAGEHLITWSGSWTSNALIKLKNRMNEQRAVAAEHAAVIANAYTGYTYPQSKLWLAWNRFLARQHHDDIAGTSNVAADAFTYRAADSSFADFTQVLNEAENSFSAALDTRVAEPGRIPVVIFNQLSTPRWDIVEATVNFGAAAPAGVKVYDPAGNEVPAQILGTNGQTASIAFVAHAPSAGSVVYEVKPTAAANPPSPNLTVDAATGILENKYYRVTVDHNGDISAILDKKTNKQLLSAPSRLEGRTANIDAYTIPKNVMAAAPIWAVDQAVVKTVAESGPARVSLKITRTRDGSTFTQYVTLGADSAGTSVIVSNTVDWKAKDHVLLSVSFPTTSSNANATYDLGLGTIQRPNWDVDPNRYDHVGQQFADVTHSDNSYGLSIINDCKYGWHRPGNSLLYLDLINGGSGGWGNYQGDHYVHNFKYGFYGHAGDWTNGSVVEAARLNQPLLAFQATPHTGALGKTFSLLHINTPQVFTMAVKKAEKGSAFVVRVRETAGKPVTGAAMTFASPILAATELMGSEEVKAGGSASFTGNTLAFNMTPYQPKTFSVALSPTVSGILRPAVKIQEGLHIKKAYFANNAFNILVTGSVPGTGVLNVRILNPRGQTIYAAETGTPGKTMVIPAPSLAEGTYMIEMKNGVRTQAVSCKVTR